MKIQQRKKYISLLLLAGFFLGILYANLVAKKYMVSTGIFSEHFLSQYVAIELIPEEYLVYILQIRLFPVVGFLLIGQTKFRKPAVVGWILWIGFSLGMLIVASIMQLGASGILLCMIGMTPQFLFYAMAYIVFLWYLYTYPASAWNRGKTIFVVLTMALGILTEVYVNPILMKLFVNAM